MRVLSWSWSGALALLFAGGLGVPAASAQTLWAIEGSGPSYGEFNAPPAACVPGPVPYSINPAPIALCPTNMPFPALVCIGGTAVDNNGNFLSGGAGSPVIVNSDGFMLEMTTPAGAYITSGPVGGGAILPGAITGVACDSLADIYYLTDGIAVVGVGIPPGPAGGCAPPPVIVPPFLLPIPAPACGLAYDPCTGSFWTCSPGGAVVNWVLGGGVVVAWAATPPLAPTLTGITINTTNGNVVVTDGGAVAEFFPAGVLAPPGAFYLAANPYPAPVWAGPLEGLGFALAAQPYGTGCDPAGGTGPSLGTAGGYTYAGNPALTLTQTGATGGFLSFLLVSLAPACPPLAFGCGRLWVSAPFFAIIGTGFIPGSGTTTLPIPLPPPAPPPCGLPVGVPVFFQYANVGGGLTELSNAVAMTIGAP